MQYATYKEEFQLQNNTPKEFCEEHGLAGFEVYMDDIVPRIQSLHNHDEIVHKLNSLNVKRVHCAYWPHPTSFLTKNNFEQLVERFEGDLNAVVNFYGDLTGEHMFKRWADEYRIACELKAQSYVFHLIDYAPIDGKWKFTISKADIRQAMIYMIQHFLNYLMDQRLLSKDSPLIEVENAGWGLEHGMQIAEDYEQMYSQLYDPFNKVKIGWDLNHLLHALGFDENEKRAKFFLPKIEISSQMEKLQNEYGNNPKKFAEKWLELNILNPKLVNRIGSLHVADCELKNIEYFSNGQLTNKYYEELIALNDWQKQQDYGLNIVLSFYDSHVLLGEGTLNPSNIRELIRKIQKTNPDMVILHELKNNVEDQYMVLNKQIELLDI